MTVPCGAARRCCVAPGMPGSDAPPAPRWTGAAATHRHVRGRPAATVRRCCPRTYGKPPARPKRRIDVSRRPRNRFWRAPLWRCVAAGGGRTRRGVAATRRCSSDALCAGAAAWKPARGSRLPLATSVRRTGTAWAGRPKTPRLAGCSAPQHVPARLRARRTCAPVRGH